MLVACAAPSLRSSGFLGVAILIVHPMSFEAIFLYRDVSHLRFA